MIEPIVDLYFHVQGREIDADHGYSLYAAVSRIVETEEDRWLHNADNVGLIPIRGRFAGQGKLVLSESARFGLRLPAELVPKALAIAGRRLEIGRASITVGVPTTSALIPAATLYAHIVTTKNGEDGQRFDDEVARQLASLGVAGKPERGPRRVVRIKGKTVVGYSLFMSELSADESLRLQEQGIGGRRKMGCGVFLPRSNAAF